MEGFLIRGEGCTLPNKKEHRETLAEANVHKKFSLSDPHFSNSVI